MTYQRYPILTRILVVQTLVITFGLAALYAVHQYALDLRRSAEQGRLKNIISPTLLGRQEQWRAWTYLGLADAAIDEMKGVKEQFHLKDLKVIPGRLAGAKPVNSKLILPSNYLPDDLVVVADLDGATQAAVLDAPLFVLIAVFSLLGLVTLGAGRYMHQRIYVPMLALGDLLSQPGANPTEEILMLNAKGEMRTVADSVLLILGRMREFEKTAAFAAVAAQVSHDIRSPLTALELVSGSLNSLEEEKALLIRTAIGRIRNIADDLVRPLGSVGTTPSLRASSIPSLVQSIVREKSFELSGHAGLKIEFTLPDGDCSACALVDAFELKRVISNLINNAVEALDDRPVIRVEVSSNQDFVTIVTADSGRGIPATLLGQLGRKGLSVAKRNGQGLGLYHARTSVESWGGQLDIHSAVGVGTTVKVVIPRAGTPVWAFSKLRLDSLRTIVIADDDPSVFQVWSGRLATLGIALVYFGSTADLNDWLNDQRPVGSDTLLLIDHDFSGSKSTGLDIIERHGIQGHSVLATSRADDVHVLERCASQGIKVLPKWLSGYVGIVSQATVPVERSGDIAHERS